MQAYQIMHKAKEEGKIRSVGASNFNIHHIEAIRKCGLPKPSVNQIEMHPFLAMKELIEYCQKEGILIEAYSPVAKANEKATTNQLLKSVGEKHEKTWAQVLLFSSFLFFSFLLFLLFLRVCVSHTRWNPKYTGSASAGRPEGLCGITKE